jgi:type II secretory pathway component GspD/PulD (secretin)
MKQTCLSGSGASQNYFKDMKRILLASSFVGILATCVAGYAQTNSPADDAAAPAPSAAPAKDAAPAAAAAQPATPDAATEATTNNAAPPAAAANDSTATPTDSAKPFVMSQTATIIPLIVMDDVPLTDAIRNLARQAGLNYMLDPKIGFGQIGPDGKPTPQPSVSIRWENITAEQALLALLNNYTLELTEDPKSKIARVTVKNPAAKPPLFTKIIQLKFASPSNLVANVKASFTDQRSKVMPDVRTSQLVVVATEQEITAVDEMVQRLDTQTKQVLIEARVLETTVNPTTVKGVDWTGTLAAQHVRMGNNSLPGVAPTGPTTSLDANGNPVTVPGSPGSIGGILSSPMLLMNASQGSFFNPAMAFLNADGVSAIISFLNTYAKVRELSTPRTVTLDNEKAVVEVGQLYPIVNVSAGTANTTGGSQITYSNLTVRLEVTPRISANDFVNLTVHPSITKLGPKYTSTVGNQANSVDSFYTRNMSTHVMIPSGNTLVMGGLIQDAIKEGNVKVPLLGDIPVLGYLFRQDSKDRSKTDLVLFITPTIVQDEDYQPTKTDYLKTPVPKKDVLEGDWSAWDSGEPKDWSKKTAKPDFQDPNAPTQ